MNKTADSLSNPAALQPPLSERLLRALVCPQCLSSELAFSSQCVTCRACHAEYPVHGGQVDFRLRSPKRYTVDYTLDTEAIEASAATPHPVPPNPDAVIDYKAIPLSRSLTTGNRLTAELLSYFPHFEAGGLMLDLGCGRSVFRYLAGYTGLEYVGIDYDGKAAILADAHSLPFADESFDFIMAIAVLEHVRYPVVMLREVARVLKPGCRFVGTMAFLEPFHLQSYYHATHLGTYNLLVTAGLEIEQFEANADWSGLRAMARMSLFRHAPKRLADLAVLPLELAQRLWWKLTKLAGRSLASSDAMRVTENTGGFRFICHKA